MGAFGTGILENDSTVGHLIFINTLWDLKYSKEQIQDILEKNYLEDGDEVLKYDIDKFTEFWTAIAFAEWFYDKPTKKAIKKIEKIINSNNSFDSWGESNERMKSIEIFFQVLQKPRIENEKTLWKIWFWENTKDITKNEFSENLMREYRVLSDFRIKNINEILLNKYHSLTKNFEEVIFWATLGKCEKEFDEIKDETILRIEELEKNPNSMNVIKVAYNEFHRNEIMNSLKEIKLKK